MNSLILDPLREVATCGGNLYPCRQYMLCSALGVLRQQQIVLPCCGACMSTSELLEVAEAMRHFETAASPRSQHHI